MGSFEAMTPCIKLLKQRKIPYTLHQYTHDKTTPSYGKEAIDKLGVEAERVFKTLVVSVDGGLVVAVVPALLMLNMKLLAKTMGKKKATMAETVMVEKTTGYLLGGVSPLAQKKRLPTFIDSSASDFETIYVSAGKRGLEVELSPHDLSALTDGVFEELC